MEENLNQGINNEQSNLQIEHNVCSLCHQPLKSEYYFCPNCGHEIKSKPLSTSIGTQIGIYAFALILPMILFIYISKWPVMKYIKSNDPKAKRIGYVAMTLIILSTFLLIYLSFVWTNKMIKSSIDSINADFNF